MTVYELQYRSKRTGKVKVYRYEPRDLYIPAADRCVGHMPLTRAGRRWVSRGNVVSFNDSTVQQAVASGRARIIGDVVRPA